jgi:hypothetical protein
MKRVNITENEFIQNFAYKELIQIINWFFFLIQQPMTKRGGGLSFNTRLARIRIVQFLYDRFPQIYSPTAYQPFLVAVRHKQHICRTNWLECDPQFHIIHSYNEVAQIFLTVLSR